jgi:uncharacterized repeat protein (TIGR01451 family)
VINTNGTYTYTPAVNYNGSDTFTYQVCDNGTPSKCATATVSITVTAVNDPPVAVNDAGTVYQGGILNGTSLLSNDSDPDGNTLTINTTAVIEPSNGTLVINADGTYTYTADASYSGTDSFIYEVCDDGTPSECSTATVNITIVVNSSTITATGTITYIYNGTPQGPATATVTGSTGAVTYSYSGTGTTTYSASATPPSAAGTYQVIASVAADANFSAATSAAYAFTINKAVLTITAGNQTVVFGTAVSSVTSAGTYTPTGFVNGETVSVISGTATYATTYTNTTAAGTSGVTITPDVTNLTAINYVFSPVNGNITISPSVTLHHFAITIPAGAQVVGTPFDITITAQDVNNNTLTGFTGTANLSTTAGSITPSVTSAFVNGVRVESVTVTNSGTLKTITTIKTGGTESGTSTTFTVNPTAPIIGTITQPTCTTTTGSVALSGLPSTGTWTIMESLGLTTISGTGSTGTFTGLAAGTYAFIVTNSTGCASTASSNAVIVENICADLAISVSGTPDPVIAGQVITYTIALSNLGNSTAQAVAVTDNLPAGLTLMSATPSKGSFTAPNWTVGTLGAGQSETLSILAMVSASAPGESTIINAVSVVSTTFDPDVANNTATATTHVDAVADLKISNTSTPDPVTAGQNLTYVIKVENLGTGDAQGVTVTDNLPAGVTLVSATPSTGTWTAPTWSAGALAAGATATLNIVVTVNTNVAAGTSVSNTATVESATFDPVATNNTATALNRVEASADLAITKSCLTIWFALFNRPAPNIVPPNARNRCNSFCSSMVGRMPAPNR